VNAEILYFKVQDIKLFYFIKLLFKNAYFLIGDDLLSSNSLDDLINQRRDSISSCSSLISLPSQWSANGPIDSFIIRSLSNSDKKKFYLYLLQITISCGFSLS